jgi:hypothetical protein
VFTIDSSTPSLKINLNEHPIDWRDEGKNKEQKSNEKQRGTIGVKKFHCKKVCIGNVARVSKC